MTTLSTELLMQLVRARYSCLVQLRDFGRQQLGLVDQGNVTGLLDLLGFKQKPLTDIQRIEKALDPYRTEDPEQRQWRSPEDRAACARLVGQCESLLQEIVTLEKRCEEIMVRQRDTTATRLQQLRAAGLAQGAYTAPSYATYSQLDLSSER